MKVLKICLLALAVLLCLIITANGLWRDMANLLIMAVDLLIILAVASGEWIVNNPRVSAGIVLGIVLWSVLFLNILESISKHLVGRRGDRLSSTASLARYKQKENEKRGFWGPPD